MNPPAERKPPIVWGALIVVPLLYAAIRQTPWRWHYSLALTLHWILAAAVIAWTIRSLDGPKAIGLFGPTMSFVAFVATICAAVGLQIAMFHDKPLADWQ